MRHPFPIGVGPKENPITNSLFSDTYFKGIPKPLNSAPKVAEISKKIRANKDKQNGA